MLKVNRPTAGEQHVDVEFHSYSLSAISGHVARLPDNTPAHQAMLRQVELSVGRPHTLHGNVHQVDPVPNGPTNSAAITTMFPLRLCEGKPLVAVTRERRYGPSRLRANDDRRRRLIFSTFSRSGTHKLLKNRC